MCWTYSAGTKIGNFLETENTLSDTYKYRNQYAEKDWKVFESNQQILKLVCALNTSYVLCFLLLLQCIIFSETWWMKSVFPNIF